MSRILVSWIGGRDLKAINSAGDDGPVLATLRHIRPERAYLLYNYPEAEVARYLEWLGARSPAALTARHAPLCSPIDFTEIHQAVEALLDEVWRAHSGDERCILLSPGTPAMQAVWILLGKTRYPASFIQASAEQGVQWVELPFEISAEFLPGASDRAAVSLGRMIAAEVPETADFDRIVTGHPRLQALKQRAGVLARFDVPVLILGETGTGKELFARAIHNSSARADKPFIALNCGAIPNELVDSTLFGHARGAFTGALRDHDGAFEQADGGTLFLDEFGELPAAAQVRLLRVLQEGVITRLGDAGERRVNVRLIAATHRDLHEAIAAHRFREDLYYRVAVGVMELPPLRERQGDLYRLIEHFLAEIQSALNLAISLELAPAARNRLLRHSWPGNIRELHATLLRAALWSLSGRLEDDDIREALIARAERSADLLERPLGEGFELDALLDEVERHYLERALMQAEGVKSQAARLLGFKSHQVLDNRLRRHGLHAAETGKRATP